MIVKFKKLNSGRVMIVRRNLPFIIVKNMTMAYAVSLGRGWL